PRSEWRRGLRGPRRPAGGAAPALALAARLGDAASPGELRPVHPRAAGPLVPLVRVARGVPGLAAVPRLVGVRAVVGAVRWGERPFRPARPQGGASVLLHVQRDAL